MTLRHRLLFAVLITLGSALVVVGIIVAVTLHLALIGEFDAALRARARAIANDVEYNQRSHALECHAPSTPEALTAVRIFDQQGAVIGGSGPQEWVDASAPDGISQHVVARTQLRQVSFRALALVEDPLPGSQPPPPIVVRIARSTADVHSRLIDLELLLGGSGLVVLAALAGCAWWIVTASLAPLGRLAGAIAALRPETAEDGIDPASAPLELVPVVDRLNHLLRRIREAMARERRFQAAIAHELRTPLAGLQTIIDVHRSGGERSGAEYREALAACAEVTAQMRSLVQGLLLLVQAGSGHLPVQPQDFDLPELIDAQWQLLRQRALDRGMRLAWDMPPTLRVRNDSFLVSLVVRNLLENAVLHGSSGGEIRVRLTASPEPSRLTITNDGCQLTQEQAGQVFDGLWRGDAARTDTEIHCGLGLTISREIIAALGGRIQVSVHDGWFDVDCLLPDLQPVETQVA